MPFINYKSKEYKRFSEWLLSPENRFRFLELYNDFLLDTESPDKLMEKCFYDDVVGGDLYSIE